MSGEASQLLLGDQEGDDDPVNAAGDDDPANAADGSGQAGTRRSCWEATKLVAEVLVLFCMLFYVDTCLDIASIWSMATNSNPKLAALNLLGIVAAGMLGLISITHSAKASDMDSAGSTIVFGFLYCLQLHVVYLTYLSIRDMRVHPFFTHVKLMESSIEAAVSANVQAYYVVWSDLEPEKRNVLLLSIFTSVVALAFGYSSFDIKSKGFDGVAGMASYSSLKFFEVMLFRICEVSTRVCGLAMFNRACRPYGAIIEVSIEALVWLLAIRHYGGWPLYAFPSVFSYMNPLLERNNAGSVPCGFYYMVRFASSLAMIAVACLWRRSDLLEVLSDDLDFAIAFAISSAGMSILLPVIRWQACNSLACYEEAQWVHRKLTTAELRLRQKMIEALAGTTEDSELLEKCLKPVKSEASRLHAVLQPEENREVNRADLARCAPQFLMAASNCPVSEGPLALQEQVCTLLALLADPEWMAQHKVYEDFGKELVHLGGVQLALDLCKTGSPATQKSAMRLALLIAKRGDSAQEELVALGAVEVAQAILESKGTLDKDLGAQAVGVLIASGLDLKGLLESKLASGDDETAIAQVMGAAIVHSVSNGASALGPELLRQVFSRCAEQPFTWRFQDRPVTRKGYPFCSQDELEFLEPSAFTTLGGLCVHAFLEQRRRGVDGTEEMFPGERAELWRWQLRTIEEFFQDFCSELENAGPRGNYNQATFDREFAEFGCSRLMHGLFSDISNERKMGIGPMRIRRIFSMDVSLEAIGTAGLRTGCWSLLARLCSTEKPLVESLEQLWHPLLTLNEGLGSDSPVVVEVVTTVATDELVSALPGLLASAEHETGAFNIAVGLCKCGPLGFRMAGMLMTCIDKSAEINIRWIMGFARPLAINERLGHVLRENRRLLELVLPVATGKGDCEYPDAAVQNAASILGALADNKEHKSILTEVAASKKAITNLVTSIGDTAGRKQLWEAVMPLVNLSRYDVGAAALTKHGGISKLRAFIAAELPQVTSAERNQRTRAMQYAMQALLQMQRSSQEAARLLADEGSDGFHAAVDSVKHNLPSLFELAMELMMSRGRGADGALPAGAGTA